MARLSTSDSPLGSGTAFTHLQAQRSAFVYLFIHSFRIFTQHQLYTKEDDGGRRGSCPLEFVSISAPCHSLGSGDVQARVGAKGTRTVWRRGREMCVCVCVCVCRTAVVCLEPSWAHDTLNHPTCPVLLTEGFVYLWSISLSLPLLQSVGALETGHRGLYLLEVRTVSGPEIGKTKGRKKQGGE